MIHREVIAEVARRLPHQSRRDVAEMVEVLTEVWRKELTAGRSIIVPDIGRLSIEVQDMKPSGFVKKHSIRLYGRFRPAGKIRDAYI